MNSSQNNHWISRNINNETVFFTKEKITTPLKPFNWSLTLYVYIVYIFVSING